MRALLAPDLTLTLRAGLGGAGSAREPRPGASWKAETLGRGWGAGSKQVCLGKRKQEESRWELDQGKSPEH